MNGPDLALAVPGPADAPAPKPAAKPTETESEPGFRPFGDDGPTFYDLLDIVNPLQHIPIVAALYRWITGDEIDPVPKIAGGALFGGPIGAAASLADVVLEEATGRDAGEHVIALLEEGSGPQAETAVAVAEPPILPAAVVSEPLPPPAGRAPAASVASAVGEHADVLAWARRERAWAAEVAASGAYRRADGLARAPAATLDISG